MSKRDLVVIGAGPAGMAAAAMAADLGLTVAVLQTVTQIQEQTLTLVPKIFAMTTVAVILLPWIVMRLAEFTREMFQLY